MLGWWVEATEGMKDQIELYLKNQDNIDHLKVIKIELIAFCIFF